MADNTLSCTVIILTRNSAGTLETCLRTSAFCSEHILLDGGSTDDTLAIAKKYGCRVVPQKKEFLDGEGRIIDFSGLWNQGIALASNPWIVTLASDEYLSDAITTEFQQHVLQNIPGVFLIRRMYMLEGRLIRYAASYPNWQYFLFHRDCARGFVKRVHERLDVPHGIQPVRLAECMYAPLPPIADLRKKNRRYLDLEKLDISRCWRTWRAILWKKSLRIGFRLMRIAKLRLLHPHAECLPLSYEWIYIWYTWRLILETCPLYPVPSQSGDVTKKNV